MEVRKLADGGYSRAVSKQAVAALDESAYRATWDALISADEEPPAVDFETEAVVFLTGGQFPTGGYQLILNSATLSGETLVVDAVTEGPPAGAITTQAITSPYVVVAVKSRAFNSVTWR